MTDSSEYKSFNEQLDKEITELKRKRKILTLSAAASTGLGTTAGNLEMPIDNRPITVIALLGAGVLVGYLFENNKMIQYKKRKKDNTEYIITDIEENGKL